MKCEYFKLLGCKTRLDIMKMLIINEQLCVCHIEEKLNLSQANASKHMKLFRDLEIVSSDKCGKNKYYYLQQDFKQENQQLIKYIIQGEDNEEYSYPC